jgi:transglutaminase superfamily protein
MEAEVAVRIISPRQDGEVRVPSVLQCGFLLLGVKMALRMRGLSWTIRYIRRRVGVAPATRSVDLDVVKAAERAVAMAGAFYPGRAMCLEQSLVLYHLLRRQGIPVKYCQGVQAHPFAAHAWVEYGGATINDVAEHVSWYARLPNELP